MPAEPKLSAPLKFFVQLHELGQGARRRRRGHHQHQAGRGELRDRREAVDRVVRQLGTQRRGDRVLVVGEQQRVAVGGRARGQLPGDHAGAAAAVVHHHLLLERFGQTGAEHARQDIRRAARRGLGDQADRPARIVVLRERRCDDCEGERYDEGGECARGRTTGLHGVAPCSNSHRRARSFNPPSHPPRARPPRSAPIRTAGTRRTAPACSVRASCRGS